ncbi:cytochrome c3 family protein [Nannocystis bainbridge]|uniref:Cytochrome c3 family protein n=1 Tax=Nannocystis bainbridge TaxID=2995303 RepID=A0ABT5E9C7_9BACT|nr:cytochrome c3 family protein [Nannocystis bainbridge]MDC0721518.1 cytochrome c3 family protein [Nannocystis bainbridge]
MAQLFRPSADRRIRLVLWGLPLGLGLAGGLGYALSRAGWTTGVGRSPAQPVPFSHDHHVGGLGLDCRYCHESVEIAAFAGLPATETCMHCHAHLFADAPLLAAVRDSWSGERPIRWRRVHDLPDFVFFDHSIHLHAGVGCETCHGRVDRMPRIHPVADLSMLWCIDCHRDPAPHLRPPADVFVMGWRPDPADPPAPGHVEAHVSCSECHR